MPEDLSAPVADEEGVVYKSRSRGHPCLEPKSHFAERFHAPAEGRARFGDRNAHHEDQSMCCYGTVPKINEWVSVRMAEEGVKPVMDEPVTIHGTLKVGEFILENGYLVGIYEMDGQQMTSDRNP